MLIFEIISAAATILVSGPTIVKALSSTPQYFDTISKEISKQIDTVRGQVNSPRLIESDKASREYIRRFKDLNDYRRILLDIQQIVSELEDKNNDNEPKLHKLHTLLTELCKYLPKEIDQNNLIKELSDIKNKRQEVTDFLSKTLKDVDDSKRKLNQALKNANLNTESFVGWDLEGIDFSQADIRNCNFTRANLAFSSLGEAKIEGADFSEAILLNASRKGLVLSESLLNPLLKYLEDAPTTPELKELLLKTAKSAPNKIGDALHKEMMAQKVGSVDNSIITPKGTHLFLKKFYEESDKVRKAVCELKVIITEITASIGENTDNYTSIWQGGFFEISKLNDLISEVSIIPSIIKIKPLSKLKVEVDEDKTRESINGLEEKLKYIQKYYPYAQTVLNSTYKYYTTIQEDHTQDFEKPFLAVIKEQIKLLSRLYPEFERTQVKYSEISTYVNRCIKQMLDYDKLEVSEEKLANNSRIVFIEDHTHNKPSSNKSTNKVAVNNVEDDEFCLLNVSMMEPKKPKISDDLQGQIDRLKTTQEVKKNAPPLDMSFANLVPNQTTPTQAQVTPSKPSTTLSSVSAENATAGEVKKEEEKLGMPSQSQALSKKQQKKQAAIGK
jgi:hypothetical protein